MPAITQLFYDPSPLGLSYSEIADRASQLPDPIELGGSRMIVHIQTSEEAVNDVLNLIRQLALEKQRTGFVYQKTPGATKKRYTDPYVRKGVQAKL